MTGECRPALRRPARALVLGCCAVLALTACTADDASRTSAPSPAESSPASGHGAATGLVASPGCEGESPNNHVVDLAWVPATPAGDGQRLVLSYLEHGLDTDAFSQSAELSPGVASYHWVHLNPGTRARYWRVLTRYGSVWVPSETGRFNGVECP